MGGGAPRTRLILRAAAMLLALAVPALARDCSDGRVDLRGPWGQARFTVEVVDSPQERAQGLMFRDSLPQSSGMLFVYGTPGRASFWMKNTLIPLDILFADATGRITRIHRDAVPGDLSGIDGGPGVKLAIEINGGLAARLGITEGTEVRHPAIAAATAVWPCG